MGNEHSGRWRGKHTRTLVEQCLQLDTRAIIGDRRRQDKLINSSGIEASWTTREWGKIRAKLCYKEDIITLEMKLECSQSQLIDIIGYRPHFGGQRYYFKCACGEKAGKLYLPPGGADFKCRKCHNLTYQSRNKTRCFYLEYQQRLQQSYDKFMKRKGRLPLHLRR